MAERIAALGVSPTPAKQFVASVTAPQLRPGDLVRLAGLDWLPESLQPAMEQVAVTQIRRKLYRALPMNLHWVKTICSATANCRILP